MALSQVAVLEAIRLLMVAVSGIDRAYSEGTNGPQRLPEGLSELPAILVYSGGTQEYILTSGQHRHTYQVKVQVLESGGDIGYRAATVLPMVNKIQEKLVSNYTLGGVCNYCRFVSDSGLVKVEYGGLEYTGREVTLLVSEQASATPATGA